MFLAFYIIYYGVVFTIVYKLVLIFVILLTMHMSDVKVSVLGLIDIVDDIIGSFVSSVKVIAFENVHNTVTAPRVITLHTQLFF